MHLSPNRNLVNALIHFGYYLREAGYKVTSAHLRDALRGLSWIQLDSKWQFKNLLRANLASGPGEFIRFDELFFQFWEKKGAPIENPDQTLLVEPPDGDMQPLALGEMPPGDEEPDRVKAGLEEVVARKDFIGLEATAWDEIEAMILKLARRLGRRLSRRYKPSTKGGRVDIRLSLRRALGRGGELVTLRHRERKIRRNRLYTLLDISGSMDIYGYFFLVFMYGLQRTLKNARSYLFSTRLSPVTRLLKSHPLTEAYTNALDLDVNWSGGTDMGTSLLQFAHDHLLPDASSRGVMLLLSDGWDCGDARQLEEAIKIIRRHCRKVIWLNPLLAFPDYQPICQGARVVLPYVDYFLPFYSIRSLEEVCRVLQRDL